MGDRLFGEESDNSDSDEAVVVESEVSDADSDDSLPTQTQQNSIVKPVDNVEEVVEVYNQFETLKKELLDTQADLTEIGDGVHVNKSGWRKIATAFNLTVEVVDKKRITDDGIVRFDVTAKAVAPNGKSTTASGLCSSNESNFMETLQDGGDWHVDDDDVFKIDGKHRRLKDPRAVDEHSIMATAETRAKNRAISDLVGGGEVSAEEMAARKKEEILE